MEKEFIPYEIALKLKELGFDEPCFGKWLSNLQSNWKDYELILEMGMNEEFEDNRNVYLLQGACSAPTYSQAFRFFREKYKLSGVPTHQSYDIYNIESEEYFIEIYPLQSYEEAELACLKKLIEIIKKK